MPLKLHIAEAIDCNIFCDNAHPNSIRDQKWLFLLKQMEVLGFKLLCISVLISDKASISHHSEDEIGNNFRIDDFA